jgi:hypothetical protein
MVLERAVEIVHMGCVMLVAVQLHRQRADRQLVAA